MVSAAVFELCVGNIDDTFTGTVRNQMYESKKILTGITKAHSTTESALIIAGTSAHIKCDHTLILIPDICHTV